MRRTLPIAFIVAITTGAITTAACVSEQGEDQTVESATGSGDGSGSGSGSGDVAALVVPTPRDRSLEILVALSSMAVVIVPSLRRKNRDVAARTA